MSAGVSDCDQIYTRILYCLLGLLRPLVFYNQLAIGQKDRLTGQP